MRFQDAFTRSQEIIRELNSYIKDDFSYPHNPLVTLKIAAGNTPYFDNYSNLATDFPIGGVSEVLTEGTLTISVGSGLHFIAGMLPLLKKDVSPEAGLFVDIASNIFGAFQSSGIDVAFAPAIFFSDSMSYLGESTINASQGSHLVIHYRVGRRHPDRLGDILGHGGISTVEPGMIDFQLFKSYFNDYNIPNAQSDDLALTALVKQNYVYSNGATRKQALAAYATSSVFNVTQQFDLNLMKKNLVAYVLVKYRSLHEIDLEVERLSENNNNFALSIPSNLLNSSSHGAISSILWGWSKSNSGYQNLLVEPALIDYDIQNDQVININDLDISLLGVTHNDINIKATIVYPDGFSSIAYVKLPYIPQHFSTSLTLPNISYFEKNQVYQAQLVTNGDAVEEIILLLNGKSLGVTKQLLSEQGSSRTYTLEFTIPSNETGTNIPISAIVDKTYSNQIFINIRDPNDIDGDQLPDTWENSLLETFA